MCPIGGSLAGGEGGLFARARMVAHCLLIETDKSGLVLVDSGLGTLDLAHPEKRLGRFFPLITGLKMGGTRPAIDHVRALGFSPKDVRHILVTHLDLDHAGGLADFKDATVHVHTNEKNAAFARSTVNEKERYKPCHFEHGPKWQTYDREGEPWNGFAAVRSLPGLPEDILAIPLFGHTRGHACIAVKGERGWLVHAGDAYFSRASIEGGDAPFGLRLFERATCILGTDRVSANHRRLGELSRTPGVEVFSAHDPNEFDKLTAGSR